MPDTYTVDIRSASGNCSDNTLTYTVDPWIRNIQVTTIGPSASCLASEDSLTFVVRYDLSADLFEGDRVNPQSYLFVAGPYDSPNPPNPQYVQMVSGYTSPDFIPNSQDQPNPYYPLNVNNDYIINGVEAYTIHLSSSANWYRVPGYYLFQYRSLVDNADGKDRLKNDFQPGSDQLPFRRQ